MECEPDHGENGLRGCTGILVGIVIVLVLVVIARALWR